MKICIPIENDNGQDSEVCLTFATAPKFMIVDPSTNVSQVVDNDDADERLPIDELVALLSEHGVTIAVVGGIDMVSLHELQAVGISVMSSPADTVRDSVSAYNNNALSPVKMEGGCSNHRPGRGFNGFGCGGSNGPGGCC